MECPSETSMKFSRNGATEKSAYFYCRQCQCGRYPLDEVLGLSAGRLQRDVQQAAVDLATEVPYETASTLFGRLSGITVSSERMHTVTQQVAEGLRVLDVAPSRKEIDQRVAQVRAGRFRRPVLVLGIDGAYVPSRPESARGRRPGQARQRRLRGAVAAIHCLEMAMHAAVGKPSSLRQTPDALLAMVTNRVKNANALGPQSHSVGPCSEGWLTSRKSALQSTRSTATCPALRGCPESQRVRTSMRVSWTSHSGSLLLTLRHQFTDT
jgi:hypothetical protein